MFFGAAKINRQNGGREPPLSFNNLFVHILFWQYKDVQDFITTFSNIYAETFIFHGFLKIFVSIEYFYPQWPGNLL